MITTEDELKAAADAVGPFDIKQLKQLLNDCPKALEETPFYHWLAGYTEGIEAAADA